jgi:murein L,D-transpeptidase YafK
MVNKEKKGFFLWVLIFLPYLLVAFVFFYYKKKVKEIKNASFIIINKSDMKMSHYDYEGKLLHHCGVATGKVFGNKMSVGDAKTPEGVFNVTGIEDASTWTHDFKDDTLGEIKGAYGPYFIRLGVSGQKGIGIHGTHDEKSIGTRASEGCIRMQNKDVEILAKSIKPSTVVVIVPGIPDIKQNILDTVKPNSKSFEKHYSEKNNNKTTGQIESVTKSSKKEAAQKNNPKKNKEINKIKKKSSEKPTSKKNQ